MKTKRKLLLLIACILLFSFMFSSVSLADTQPASPGDLDESDIIYMILTDRFNDYDSSNNGNLNNEYRPGELKYTQGGDWEGITDKMDYIADLGVTAIWISPPQENELLSRDGSESGYHGYFTHDYYSPDPHFGSLTDLQDLIDEAHSYDIKVILDAVPNHTADYLAPYGSSYSPSTYAPAAPFNNPNWYHQNGSINDYSNYWQLVNCDMGGLDDLDQSNQDAYDAIMDTYGDWVALGFDGIRVDAASSIPKDFLEDFEVEMDIPTFGEVFNGSVDFVSDFQDYQWGVLDFPLFFTARDVFANDGDMDDITDIIDQDYKYNNVNHLVTFLDNHDRDRFLCLADDNYEKLRLGMTFLFTVRGIPDVYYGTEQAHYGGGKPTEYTGIANKENREVMSSFNQTNINYKHIQRLCEIRKDYSALHNGTQREMWIDYYVYAYSRRNDTTGDEVITVLNNGWDSSTRTIPIRTESSLTVGTTLTNLLDTSETVTITSGGVTGKQISVTLDGKEGMILVSGQTDTYSPMSPNKTIIRVHYNVGYGNTMYLRGSDYPLWWDDGRAMRNTAADCWEFEIERIPNGTTFEFKPLINDTTWSQGNNYTVTGGSTIDIYPTF